MYIVYILKSQKNGRYYVGYTSDFEKRLKDHNSGKNISTRNNCPWVKVYTEEFKDKKLAWLREQQIKKYKGGEAFKKLVG